MAGPGSISARHAARVAARTAASSASTPLMDGGSATCRPARHYLQPSVTEVCNVIEVFEFETRMGADRHRVALRLALTAISWAVVVGGIAPARSAESPWLEAYEEVSPLRDRHSDVIWDGAAASPEELRTILADLNQGIATLDTPRFGDLAEGNMSLRFRRWNFQIDRI